MVYLVTFLEGVVTFLSPCLLPLLPVYLAFFAGDSGISKSDTPSTPVAKARTLRSLIGAICFVGGFTLVFGVLGVGSAAVGSLLLRYQRVLDLICGAYVVLMGLGQLDLVSIPWLDRMGGPGVGPKQRGFCGAFIFGVVFALGWSPCIGAYLSSALSLAANSGSVAQGLVLLLCYCIGLGLPFILSAVAIDQLRGALSWVRAHQRVVHTVCGILLVVVGVLMATGTLGVYLRAAASFS